MTCVCNATLLGGWHVELQTLIVLGGGANVECISFVWCPAGVDSGFVVDKPFVPIGTIGVFLKSHGLWTSSLADLLGSRHEKRRRLRASSTWCRNSSHSCRG